MDSSVPPEKKNLVSARVPSHFNWPVLSIVQDNSDSVSGRPSDIHINYWAQVAVIFPLVQIDWIMN